MVGAVAAEDASECNRPFDKLAEEVAAEFAVEIVDCGQPALPLLSLKASTQSFHIVTATTQQRREWVALAGSTRRAGTTPPTDQLSTRRQLVGSASGRLMAWPAMKRPADELPVRKTPPADVTHKRNQ